LLLLLFDSGHLHFNFILPTPQGKQNAQNIHNNKPDQWRNQCYIKEENGNRSGIVLRIKKTMARKNGKMRKLKIKVLILKDFNVNRIQTTQQSTIMCTNGNLNLWKCNNTCRIYKPRSKHLYDWLHNSIADSTANSTVFYCIGEFYRGSFHKIILNFIHTCTNKD